MSYENTDDWFRPMLANLPHAYPVWAAIALTLLITGPASAQTTPPSDEIQQITREILSSPRYQDPDLPQFSREKSDDGFEDIPPERYRPQVEPAPESSPDIDLPAPPPSRLGPVAKLALWAAIFVGVILLMAYFSGAFSQIRMRRSQRHPDDSDASAINSAASVAPQAADEFAGADRLAQQGDYGEAIHALLLHSFEHLQQRLGTSLAPSRTSREALRALPLDRQSKTALGKIVSFVERHHFGGRATDADEYRICREHCRHLTQPAAEVAP